MTLVVERVLVITECTKCRSRKQLVDQIGHCIYISYFLTLRTIHIAEAGLT